MEVLLVAMREELQIISLEQGTRMDCTQGEFSTNSLLKNCLVKQIFRIRKYNKKTGKALLSINGKEVEKKNFEVKKIKTKS